MKYIDMHCDTIYELYKKQRSGSGESLRENCGHVDLGRMEKGDAMLQNFALFVHMGKTDNPLEEALRMADLYYEELRENEDRIAPVYCFSDIEKNSREHKISALLTVEEGGVCKGETAYLRDFYRLGVRMMTLTWNYANEIGCPAWNTAGVAERTGGRKGLTEKGREFVEEMGRIGMIVDVSHLSDDGFYDVLETLKKPFVASHSNAREVCPCARNMTDDMIRKLAERGGVIGLNFCPDFLTEAVAGRENPGTVAAVAEHACHIIRVGGVECLGLGSDFDGFGGHAELPDCSYMPRLADALRKSGLSGETVEKIFYKNVLRVYKDVLTG